MRDAAQEAISFAKDRSRDELDRGSDAALIPGKRDGNHREAAGKVSQEVKLAFPRVPWVTAAGMRNRLIHAYFDISADVVWSTVKHDLPALVERLDEMLASEV